MTNRAILRDGVPWVPVSGEIHYSRLPRDRWRSRLRQLAAGGVTVASTYVFWLHHSPERGVVCFDDDLDVAGFVDECRDAGLDVVLRIGPWAHGEARNGGFPDWVQRLPITHRSDDPRYLELVREWFGQLADALGGRARPGGPVIAIQLENELYDRPEHLRTLRALAREAGMAAPLWTATAWGGAELPSDIVMPVFSGYADGFWVDPADGWQPSFRAHFFPSHEWDDPGVGADVRDAQGFASAQDPASPPGAESAPGHENPPDPANAPGAEGLGGFPPATCELGSGMATAYHRRPVPSGRDIAALAHGKIGNGSAWQGYFMYAGGRNRARSLHETQSTGYPNDMTELSYDFHAPISQSGEVAESYELLRDQHAFLRAFGPLLGDMTSSLPHRLPDGLEDRDTLRWALRSDGESAFVVVSHHQPYEQVQSVTDVSFEIGLTERTVTFPPGGVTIPPGTLARWPVSLRIGDALVEWATASALTLLDGEIPTLVLREDPGIVVEIRTSTGTETVEPGLMPLARDGFDLIVLPHDARVWVRDLADGGRVLLVSDADLAWGVDAAIDVRPAGATVRTYEPAIRQWIPTSAGDPEDSAGVGASVVRDESVIPVLLTPATHVAPADYGFTAGRHSAPSDDAFDAHAAVFGLHLPEWALDPGTDSVMEIDWIGDTAQLRCDGQLVDDRFWDGTTWSLSLADLGVGRAATVTLHATPLHRNTGIALPGGARDRLRAAGADPALAIRSVRVRHRGSFGPV